MIKKITHSIILITFIINLWIINLWTLTGCQKKDIESDDNYLIQVGSTAMSVLDFNKAFEIAKTAYSSDIENDSDIIRKARIELLKQMTERLILLERAKELQIEISDAEFENAVAEIKSDYSDEEFEHILLKSAVSYELWKKELRIRLLMEKVVAKELTEKIEVTSEDIAKYYTENYNQDRSGTTNSDNNNSENTDEMVTQQIRREKIEGLYDKWMKELRQKYVIKINEAQWKRINLK